MPAESRPIADVLPGLAQVTAPSGRLVASVTATLLALDDAGLLEPRHAASAQLCLELAVAVEQGLTRNRASAVAMAARELREALAVLPVPPERDTDDAFTQFLAELRDAPAG